MRFDKEEFDLYCDLGAHMAPATGRAGQKIWRRSEELLALINRHRLSIVEVCGEIKALVTPAGLHLTSRCYDSTGRFCSYAFPVKGGSYGRS